MARPPSPVRALRKPRQRAAAPEGQKPRGGDVEIFVRARWHGGLMSLLSLTLVVLAAFIHATWNLLAKRAAAAVVACIVLSTVIHLGYSLCLQRGYQVAGLSVVYPVARGTGPMLSSIGAFI